MGNGDNNKESCTTVDWEVVVRRPSEDSGRASGIGVSWIFSFDDDAGLIMLFRRVFVTDAISAVGIERILESIPWKEVGREGDEYLYACVLLISKILLSEVWGLS